MKKKWKGKKKIQVCWFVELSLGILLPRTFLKPADQTPTSGIRHHVPGLHSVLCPWADTCAWSIMPHGRAEGAAEKTLLSTGLNSGVHPGITASCCFLPAAAWIRHARGVPQHGRDPTTGKDAKDHLEASLEMNVKVHMSQLIHLKIRDMESATREPSSNGNSTRRIVIT